MQALFAEQIAWRDRFLRQTEPVFRDLVAAWQSMPARPSPSEEPELPGLELGMPVLSAVSRPSPPSPLGPREPPDPEPRVPVLDDPDATARALGDEEASDVVPLTRRAPLVSLDDRARTLKRRATPMRVSAPDMGVTSPTLPRPPRPTDAAAGPTPT